ncbi:hypothetical protein GN244_ATG07147 [Phytophthora infestans]|uniref:Uncharacterized protein n=1 Tax=Phytophthora infestans TaxID=4787 RepID=A0A833SG46_PHYIN|nr:hypothetical protein GN244_ATG07147 [Phytophthora infestans]
MLKAPDATIVHSPKIESAAVKVLGGHVTRLTTVEKAALFRRGPPATTRALEEQDSSLTERILKATQHLYLGGINLSNVECYGSISPMALEVSLYLKAKSTYWNVATVDE